MKHIITLILKLIIHYIKLRSGITLKLNVIPSLVKNDINYKKTLEHSKVFFNKLIVNLIFRNYYCCYYCYCCCYFWFLCPFFLVITSSTCMLTSTTSKPVMYLTCSLTKSVTLRKIFGADSPYSKITFKSTAACFHQLQQKHLVLRCYRLRMR